MRLTTPGIGRECGSTLGQNRSLYQGLFLAPHTVAQAVKTAVFAARLMELLGYEADPKSDAERHDIIQMLHLKNPEAVKRFCRGIQSGAPVDSYVTPEPWDMPGYDCPVIMVHPGGVHRAVRRRAHAGALHGLPPGRAYL